MFSEILDLLKNPWVIALLVITIASGVSYIVYPQNTNVDYTKIIEEYQADEFGVVDVVLFTSDEQEALSIIAQRYPEYDIMEKFYVEKKKAWAFRLIKKQ